MAVSSYNIAPGQSQAEVDMKRKIALALIERGTSPRQIDHWTQGLAQMAEAGLGGWEMAKINKADKEERAKGNELLASALTGGSPQAAPAAAPAAGGDTFANAISGIESGGRYDALGPVTKTGDRAYGKYQIMGANVPQWTKAHLGQEMDPQAFLANPQAQDAVFRGQFGQYAQKYGPEGAARAWFAGEGGMNDPNRRDQLGTTVAQYGQKFAQALGPQGAPAAAPAPDNRAAIIQMLGNRYTAPIAQQMLAKQLGRDPLDVEAKHLDIATKRKVLEASPTVQRIKQPDGSEVAVQWDAASKQWVPLKAPEGGNPVASPKLTEQQSKDVGFYNRGQKLLPRLEKQDVALTDLMSAGGATLSNYFKTDAYRQAEQTGRELLAVILRKDTGAAVTPSEMELYGSIYLPKPGDDAQTIQQKRIARQTAIEGLRMGLGPADIIFKSREAAEAAAPPAPPAAATKVRKFNPETGKIE